MTVEEAHDLIRRITEVVNHQLEDRVRIYEQKILTELRRNHVIFYQSKSEVEDFHREFVHRFFMEEVFPYLQPMKMEPFLLARQAAVSGGESPETRRRQVRLLPHQDAV